MLGSSSTTSSLASARCRASVSVSMLCILALHAEDNLNARWIRSPFRGPGPTAQGPRGAGRLPVRGPGGLTPVGDGGGSGAHAELRVDPADVILHGLLGQEQASGDLPVGLPVRDEGHDLRLARGQSVRLPGPVGSRAESESLVYARPRDLSIVHLTSGCGRRIRTAANYRTRSQPMKVHANDHMSRYEPT